MRKPDDNAVESVISDDYYTQTALKKNGWISKPISYPLIHFYSLGSYLKLKATTRYVQIQITTFCNL